MHMCVLLQCWMGPRRHGQSVGHIAAGPHRCRYHLVDLASSFVGSLKHVRGLPHRVQGGVDSFQLVGIFAIAILTEMREHMRMVVRPSFFCVPCSLNALFLMYFQTLRHANICSSHVGLRSCLQKLCARGTANPKCGCEPGQPTRQKPGNMGMSPHTNRIQKQYIVLLSPHCSSGSASGHS